MPSFNPRKFTDPDWLGRIAPDRLARFLAPWQSYLAARGCDLSAAAADGPPNHARLAAALVAPDADCPKEMVEAIYYVHETATPEDMEHLLREGAARDLRLPHDPQMTPTDLAIEVWLADAGLLQVRHAEVLARRQQSFDYFAGRAARARPFPQVDDVVRQRIEAELDDWFAAHRRGRGCRLFLFPEPPHVWLLVRHGEVMRREASHGEDGQAGVEFYRPQRHDVLIYDEATDEMGVHAGTKGERRLYLSAIGRHLFGDSDYFPPAAKFTLEPLLRYGAASLACGDVDGIERVRLVEYRQFWGGSFKETEVRRASDIFAALRTRGADAALPHEPSAAVFRVRFTGVDKERTLTIRTPGSARYERKEDSEAVEQWLRARGFLLTRPQAENDEDATSVVGSASSAARSRHRSTGLASAPRRRVGRGGPISDRNGLPRRGGGLPVPGWRRLPAPGRLTFRWALPRGVRRRRRRLRPARPLPG